MEAQVADCRKTVKWIFYYFVNQIRFDEKCMNIRIRKSSIFTSKTRLTSQPALRRLIKDMICLFHCCALIILLNVVVVVVCGTWFLVRFRFFIAKCRSNVFMLCASAFAANRLFFAASSNGLALRVHWSAYFRLFLLWFGSICLLFMRCN